MVFICSLVLYYFYNMLVEKRQQIVLNKAVHSTAIVSSLFPKQVRDRLLQEDKESKGIQNSGMKSFITADGDQRNMTAGGSQIADLFPNCTVLFADIAGFTAWASTRGPDHVFILLQSVFHEFDQVAKRRKVFKVETIGDCYLAVTGLPDPQPDHAVIMGRFAHECKLRMLISTKELDLILGPDCSELKVRFGMHSGPVTAGVLRGDRARFQLFGDTVNTGMFSKLLHRQTIVL
jgi:Adenylate and Guanylate cyclase catalytic domain